MDFDPRKYIPRTKALNPAPSSGVPLPDRGTGPLDMALPWVIELRIIGTASTIQMRLHEMIVLGREDSDNGSFPHVDLTPYQAFTLGVSRRHAAILVRNGRVTIKDLNSTNGTQLNGFDLTPGQEYRLRHDDELRLGQLRIQVLFTVMPARPKEDDDTLSDLSTIRLDATGRGQHVLIVEDDEEVGLVFSMALEQSGYRVTVVGLAMDALNIIQDERPDLMILDLMLPDMSGLEVLHFIRKHNIARIPTVVVSGATGGYQMNRALEAGAIRFLGKPISIEDLMHHVHEAAALQL